MIATARARICGSCPECGAFRVICPDDLGRESPCEACGTVFVILRRVRKRRVPRTMRPVELEEATCGGSRPASASLGRVCILVATLFLVATLALLAALNADRIAAQAQDAWDRLVPPSPERPAPVERRIPIR